MKGYDAPDFHPHGIYAVKDGNEEWVYVVNHRRDGEMVSIFQVVQTTSSSDSPFELKYLRSVTNPEWKYINDIAVVPNSQGVFYVTNWFHDDPGSFKGAVEFLMKSKWAHALVCGETNKPLSKSEGSEEILNIDCRRVAEELISANGVAISNDGGNVLVVNTGLSEIVVYDRDSTNNNLKLKNRIVTRAPCDNINIDRESGDLYGSCYPKPLRFLWAGWNYPKAKAHSRLIRIKNGFHDTYETVVQSNGELISTSSGCARFKNTLVASSLHDAGFAVCHL